MAKNIENNLLIKTRRADVSILIRRDSNPRSMFYGVKFLLLSYYFDLLMIGHKSSVYHVQIPLFTNQSTVPNCQKMTIVNKMPCKNSSNFTIRYHRYDNNVTSGDNPKCSNKYCSKLFTICHFMTIAYTWMICKQRILYLICANFMPIHQQVR